VRILAALFGILAVTVWWAPLPNYIQSLILVSTAMMCLAFRRAIFLPKDAVLVEPGDPAPAETAGPDSNGQED
jgi:hypothetical protein